MVGKPTAFHRRALHHTVAPSSLDTNIASDYRVGGETYNFFNIEDIRPGQLVLALNPATGQLEPRRVLQTFRRITYHLRHLTFQSPTGAQQTFETTDEHPFWSQRASRWTPAGDLQPGDRVIDPHGEQSLLVSTHREPHPEGVTVYNFQVEGFHSYFVAAKGPGGQPVLVHNAGYGTADVSTLKGRQLASEFTGNKIKRFRRQMQSQGGYGDFPPIKIAEIDGKKIIIDGHHRARAAGAAGIKHVPVEIIDLPPDVTRKFLQQAAEAAERLGLPF